jgi:hypothetical protein
MVLKMGDRAAQKGQKNLHHLFALLVCLLPFPSRLRELLELLRPQGGVLQKGVGLSLAFGHQVWEVVTKKNFRTH